MNKAILVGRLTKDPELKRTSNDIPFVQFTIAINRTYSNKQGEKQADFISCVAWRNQAENLARYMRKGSLIGVDGQIQTRNFDDPNGVRRYVTEVICDSIQFLESKSMQRDNSPEYSDMDRYDIQDNYRRNQNEYQQREQTEQKDPFEDIKKDITITNDDLPF